jgi:hypothetical protein
MAGHWNRGEVPSKTLTQRELERRRELISNAVARRQSRAGEQKLTVQVTGPNPISHGGNLYVAGTQFQIRRELAEALIAKGHVSLAP